MRPGLEASELQGLFGTPDNVERFVGDRINLEWNLERGEHWILSCTVHDRDGLIFVVLRLMSAC